MPNSKDRSSGGLPSGDTLPVPVQALYRAPWFVGRRDAMGHGAGFDESIKRLLVAPHASHKLYIWREILDRIYLDSCSLVDILLGRVKNSTASGTSRKKLTREKELVRARDEELARRI